MKTIGALLLLASLNAFATPKHLEVWFLSIDKTSWLDGLLKNEYKPFKVARRNLQCQKMGDYCFDPQVGLYKPGEEETLTDEIDMAEVETSQKYDFIDPHKGVERSLIECDENSSFFDIFCGKSKKKSLNEKTKLEVWVDVSSTMKQVDFQGFDKQCKREQFIRSLAKTCPLNEKMKVYHFEEYRVEVGSLDRVCLSGGLNNMKRLVQDFKKSKADNIIIITDIFEADESFINEIEATGRSTIRGLKKPIYAADLKNELQRVRKLCQ